MTEKRKIVLELSDPELVALNVYKTTITHPLLTGELSFIHGQDNRDVTLEKLTSNIIDDIVGIISDIDKLTTTGKKKS